MGSQEQGGIMTPLNSPSCVILCLFVTTSRADLEQGQADHRPYEPPLEGGYVSPSTDFGENLAVKQYERPDLPYSDYYVQTDAGSYGNYNIDEIEKQDELEVAPILSIVVPSLVIGLVALAFGLGFGSSTSRSDDSFFSFFSKPQVENNIVIDDMFNLGKILRRFKRSASSNGDTDYVAYLLNSVEVISNKNVSLTDILQWIRKYQRHTTLLNLQHDL